MNRQDDNQAAMEKLWKSLSTREMERSGQACIIFEGDHDLSYLYETGFVDTESHSRQEWIAAFHANKEKNGFYKLQHKDWLAKTPFRYAGPVSPAFDPSTLRDGEWTKDDFIQMLEEKFFPQVSISKDRYFKALESATTNRDDGSSKIIVNSVVKGFLRNLLEHYPSPQRYRSLGVAREQKKQAPVVTKKTNGSIKMQSEFTQSPDEKKTTLNKLSDLLGGGR
jgi:hypothetical protein